MQWTSTIDAHRDPCLYLYLVDIGLYHNHETKDQGTETKNPSVQLCMQSISLHSPHHCPSACRSTIRQWPSRSSQAHAYSSMPAEIWERCVASLQACRHVGFSIGAVVPRRDPERDCEDCQCPAVQTWPSPRSWSPARREQGTLPRPSSSEVGVLAKLGSSLSSFRGT